MSWKEILKVDNVVFEPDNPNTAWYDPQKDEITLNLSSVGSEGEDDEFVIMNLEQIAVHENAHRAVKYVMGDAFKKLLDRLGESVANALNGETEESGSELHDLLDALIQNAKIWMRRMLILLEEQFKESPKLILWSPFMVH